jgi:hypothetical protein
MGAHIGEQIVKDWQGVQKGPHETRIGDAAQLGFILCGKCGLPFIAKGMGAHARTCNGILPRRPLDRSVTAHGKAAATG